MSLGFSNFQEMKLIWFSENLKIWRMLRFGQIRKLEIITTTLFPRKMSKIRKTKSQNFTVLIVTATFVLPETQISKNVDVHTNHLC